MRRGLTGLRWPRTAGNLWTAYPQIITAVIGSGVLSLVWCVALLGWIVGPLTMVAFAAVTLTSAIFLCTCYKSTHPDSAPATVNVSYLDAVCHILGDKNALVCKVVVRINFVKLGIVATIASSISTRAIHRSNCCHNKGHKADCEFSTMPYILVFGAFQVIMSQIESNFQNTVWLSFISASISFTYSTIGLGLGFAKVSDNGGMKGSISGVVTSSAAEKVWAISQVLGNIAFAFPFSVIFLEIQDALRDQTHWRTQP